ncbi:MAG: DUF262 domain-containing HNH endonuclease family protein [Spongiibacteraceae bacterium]
MIKSVNDYPVSALLNGDNNVIYHIPRYQREYSWGKSQWENLFDDLLENDRGYFLGSIICINQSDDSLADQTLELVDGQQRMTTLSLFLAALYACFQIHKADLDEDQQADVTSLKYRMLLKKTFNPRLELQAQNNNANDYCAILCQVGLLEDVETVANAGNRRVFKAFRYFQSRIASYCEDNGDVLGTLFELLESVNQAVLVKIEVSSHSDAYVLFESLNNRGAPLTAIDLVKNKLLAEVGRIDQSKIDPAFDKWKRLLAYLGDDYGIQERFFRQYYNAFQSEFKAITKVPFVTRSSLIQVYEKLISNDVFPFLTNVLEAGRCYAQIIGDLDLDDLLLLDKPLENLEHIQGAPSYILLLFLWLRRDPLGLDDRLLKRVVDLLVVFFVRRNLTDTPPTRDLDRMFVSMISAINEKHLMGEAIYELIQSNLLSVSASLERMQESLNGDLYLDNSAVARFILCALEESTMTRETQVDLWKLDKHKKYEFTIEHIFPQGENIPEHWVEMIAGGDRDQANLYRDQYVHKLGNLTISGFNSALGTKSFVEKRDRTDKQGRAVGYKNGLKLNAELALKNSWQVGDIEERTQQLIDKVMELFLFEQESCV